MFERRWPAFCTEVVSSRSILEKGWFKFRGVSWILNVSGMFAGRHAETKRFARIPSGVKRLKDLFNLMCILQYVHLSVQLAMITSVFAPELSSIPKVECVHIHINRQQEDHLLQVNLSRQPYQLWETPSSLLALRRAKGFGAHVGIPGNTTPNSVLTLDQ